MSSYTGVIHFKMVVFWPTLYCSFVAVFVLKIYIVIIPLIVNVTGFIVSLLMRPVSDRIGKKVHIYCTLVKIHTLYVVFRVLLIGPPPRISILLLTKISRTFQDPQNVVLELGHSPAMFKLQTNHSYTVYSTDTV